MRVKETTPAAGLHSDHHQDDHENVHDDDHEDGHEDVHDVEETDYLHQRSSQNLKIKSKLISPQFEQRWSALDKPPGQMAVAKLEDAGESWERFKQEAFRRKANRAVRAFRVNRDSGVGGGPGALCRNCY